MPKLNTPCKLGPIELKNRMVMAPMGLCYPGGFTKEVFTFYKERIKGGASMILIGCAIPTPFEDMGATMVFDHENKDMLKALVDIAHAHDCKVALQIMLGSGRLNFSSPQYGVPCAASAVPTLWDSNVLCHEFTKEEIGQLKELYRRSVEIGVECGIDAVETHSYGGYLLDQFLTKRWNSRADEYGGNLDGRMRLLLETVDIVKEVGKGKLAVICKITPDHLLPAEEGWRGMDEGIELAKKLEAHGVDALHICAGCYENWENGMPVDYFQEMVPHIHSAEIIKKHVQIPVIAHGRLNNPVKARHVVETGMADIVGIARGTLADPDLPNKILKGDTDAIIPCISCDEGCIANIGRGKHVTCAVNPRCCFETERNLRVSANPKRVLIVGAGPGGCCAAIYAKQCGHDVEIWERGSHIGGNAFSASMPVFKRDMEELLKFHKHMLDKLDIRVRFMTEATPEKVAVYAPEHLIWAAGGIPVRPASIPGIHGANVCLAAEALENRAYVGKRIVIVGGGMVGCEAAAHFAHLDKEVSIVEMEKEILHEDIFVQSRIMLLKWLNAQPVKKYEGTKLVAANESSVTVERDGETFEIPCDTVCLAMGFKPNLDALEKYRQICPVTPIGDAVQLGRILHATAGAFEAVMALDA